MTKKEQLSLLNKCTYWTLGISLTILSAIVIANITNPGVKCIDGDTFAIGDTYYRLAYIDTPEKGRPGYRTASNFTCNVLNLNDFTLKDLGKDKYERTLVEVKPQGGGASLNELLIENCYAIPFYGKTNQKILGLYNKCK